MARISRSIFRRRLALVPTPTNLIAKYAIQALTLDDFPRTKGWCQMWARLVYTRALGNVFEFAHLPSAQAACKAFKNTRYVVPKGLKLEAGDILYKQGLPGQFGHVGIYVGHGYVAENSTIHDTTGDARGLRSLTEFGPYTLAVRYPPPISPNGGK